MGSVIATHLRRRGREEVVDLFVNVLRTREILNTANLGLDQVVAVNRGRDSSGVHFCRHKLQKSHLIAKVS